MSLPARSCPVLFFDQSCMEKNSPQSENPDSAQKWSQKTYPNRPAKERERFALEREIKKCENEFKDELEIETARAARVEKRLAEDKKALEKKKKNQKHVEKDYKDQFEREMKRNKERVQEEVLDVDDEATRELEEAVNAPFLFFAGEIPYLCFTGSRKYF